jgi:hypothetical protein
MDAVLQRRILLPQPHKLGCLSLFRPEIIIPADYRGRNAPALYVEARRAKLLGADIANDTFYFLFFPDFLAIEESFIMHIRMNCIVKPVSRKCRRRRVK